MSSEAKPTDAEIVAEWIGRTVKDAELSGAPASVVLRLQRIHDHTLDIVAHARIGWQ